MERSHIQSEITHTSSSTTWHLGSCRASESKIILCCLGAQPQTLVSNQQGLPLAKINFTGGCHSFTGWAAWLCCIFAVQHQSGCLSSFLSTRGVQNVFGKKCCLHLSRILQKDTRCAIWVRKHTVQEAFRGNRGGNAYLGTVYALYAGNSPSVLVLLPSFYPPPLLSKREFSMFACLMMWASVL